MEFTCEKCGWWADVNGVCVCGYSGRPTTRHDSCTAWKTSITTNADRIRSMTDEDLAEFFVKKMDYICRKKDRYCDGLHCVSCTVDWLREEAQDG